MGNQANSAATYAPTASHPTLSISPIKGKTATVGFRMHKDEFRKFCIDGLALCEDEEVGTDILVTAHRDDQRVTTIGRKI